jgi:hypothetical protein
MQQPAFEQSEFAVPRALIKIKPSAAKTLRRQNSPPPLALGVAKASECLVRL